MKRLFTNKNESRFAVAYRWNGESKVEIDIVTAMGVVMMKADPQIEILTIKGV